MCSFPTGFLPRAVPRGLLTAVIAAAVGLAPSVAGAAAITCGPISPGIIPTSIGGGFNIDGKLECFKSPGETFAEDWYQSVPPDLSSCTAHLDSPGANCNLPLTPKVVYFQDRVGVQAGNDS